MPFVTIQVTGLDQIRGGLNNFIRQIPETNRKALEESTSLFERVAKEKVHVITGRTKRSIVKLAVTPQYGIVQARWGAKFEELREGTKGSLGPHKFLTETAAVVKQEMPNIIKKHYDELVRRSV